MLIRKARSGDVPEIARLVNQHADIGDVLPRSEEELHDVLRDFFVACSADAIVGCSSLHVMGESLAEIRSLIVAGEVQGQGLGKQLVDACLREADELDISHVFALTSKPAFFEKLGFERVPRSTFPQKIWRDCFKCRFFEACGEVAVQLIIDKTADAG